jgi:hypothetical protein
VTGCEYPRIGMPEPLQSGETLRLSGGSASPLALRTIPLGTEKLRLPVYAAANEVGPVRGRSSWRIRHEGQSGFKENCSGADDPQS